MRSPDHRNRTLPAIVIVLLATSFPGTAQPAPEPIVQTYLELCSVCHTIGEGPGAGPDLLPATQWPRADLRAVVERMQDNTGPLTDEQMDGLVDLLKDPAVKGRIAGVGEQQMAEKAASLNPAFPQTGRQLFFGEKTFAKGGTPCFACHAAGGRGGNLAADLTSVHARMGEVALVSAIEKPGFPLMKTAYRNRPVNSQEALDLAAFLAESAGNAAPGSPVAEGAGPLHGAAAGVALAVLAAVGLVFRSRRDGVRSRMVRNSSGGE